MWKEFRARALQAGAEVERVAGRAEALDVIERVLAAEGVCDAPGREAVWAPCPFLQGLDAETVLERLPGLRFDVTLARAAGALVGISQADWGIADTGTLAQDCGAVAQRLVSTLPGTHLALLEADRLVPDLATYLSVQPPTGADYLGLITGPSRTADIERVLTIGVHGPRRLVVVVVDGLTPNPSPLPAESRRRA
ncbi:MAG TPA: lactate utilization protein [Kineosporiaceae bacterium]|nr:lactate utilization protein [Kineosporiaceae bacterium]